MKANTREANTIDAIALLAADTASYKYTYTNLSGTVASLMAELVLANKNLVEALKENPRLERVLGQCQKCTSTAGGGGTTGRGCTSQQEKWYHYLWSCGYDAGKSSFKCTAKALGHIMHCSVTSKGGFPEKQAVMTATQERVYR